MSSEKTGESVLALIGVIIDGQTRSTLEMNQGVSDKMVPSEIWKEFVSNNYGVNLALVRRARRATDMTSWY